MLESCEPRALMATGIEGVKFLDYDENGVFGPGDTVSSVPVEIRAYVDSNGDGKLDQAEYDAGFAASDLTDPGSGAYALNVAGGAEYIVVEVIDPSQFAQVPLGQSVLEVGLNTGNTIGAFGYAADMTYAGTVFAVNSGSSPFAGTIFQIDTTDGQVVDPGPVWNTDPDTLRNSAPNGLAFDLETNTLYYSTLGVANPNPGSEYGTDAQLWKVDLATNVPSLVATLEGSVAGASFRDGAYLYVAQNTGDLWSYDVVGGVLSMVVDLNTLPLPNYDPATRLYFGDVAVKGDVLYGMGTLDPSQPLNGATDEAFFWAYDLEAGAFLEVSSYTPNPLISGIAFGGDGELYAHFYGPTTFVINQIPLNGDPAVPLGPALDRSKYAINDMASNLVLSGRDFANYPRGDEGLSHGYWKTHASAWAATGFAQTDLVKDAFGLTNEELTAVGISTSTTLQQALNFGGGPGVPGGARNLLKQAVASLLNAAHPGVQFHYLVSEVKSLTVAAIQSANRSTMLALAAIFDDLNNGIHPF